MSPFWTGSGDNLPVPIFSSFTQILLLAAAYKLVSSSLTALQGFHQDYKKNDVSTSLAFNKKGFCYLLLLYPYLVLCDIV